MSVFLVVCSFASFCGTAGCPDGRGDHAVRARIDPEAMFAEFWTNADISNDPWPAVLQHTGFSRDVWVLFSAGPVHGHWMLTVVPSTGDGMVSAHSFGFGSDIVSGRGTCTVAQDAN